MQIQRSVKVNIITQTMFSDFHNDELTELDRTFPLTICTFVTMIFRL